MRLLLTCALTLCLGISLSRGGSAQSPSLSGRTLKICVASNAPEPIRRSAAAIHDGITASPLLSLLASNGSSMMDCSGSSLTARAYSHLVLVGLPSDPLIQAAWQREALVEDGGLYIFGFGHLQGTIGYVESGRNPFLHSAAIHAAPYETEVITVTGSSPEGVRLAADALVKGGLINGAVAAPGWTRPRTTILDRDPLTTPVTMPAMAPVTAGDAKQIGWTQAGESEYRDVFEDAGAMPRQIWRVKYSQPGMWDEAAPQEGSSILGYLTGLHRRAFASTLWLAEFASPEEAATAVGKIAVADHLKPNGNSWRGAGPSVEELAQHGMLAQALTSTSLWTVDNLVLMSSVPQLQH